MSPAALRDEDYRRLLEFRDGLRRFLAWSAQAAKEVRLTPSQHQALLAVRGHPGPDPPTVGDIAAHLLLRHHSAVELLDRCQEAGLVERRSDEHDQRVVRIHLTAEGERRLAALSAVHLEELARLSPRVAPAWEGLQPEARSRLPSVSRSRP